MAWVGGLAQARGGDAEREVAGLVGDMLEDGLGRWLGSGSVEAVQSARQRVSWATCSRTAWVDDRGRVQDARRRAVAERSSVGDRDDE